MTSLSLSLLLDQSGSLTHRVLSPVLVELLLRLAGEAALGAGVGPLAAVVHLVLLELPLGAEDLLADAALLGVLRVVDLEVQAQRAQLLEALLALRTLEHAVHRRVRLQRIRISPGKRG